MPSNKAINLAIFASGSGSNAENIIAYFKDIEFINISLIVSNRQNAYVLERGKTHNIPSEYIPKEAFTNKENVLKILTNHKIDFIILAGFLLLIPEYLIKQFPNKIINIHPSLLPKFGGKGMYGMHVHKAVHQAKESESGMTIHYVNEAFDEGEIIAQFKVVISENDTPEEIAAKVLELEHLHYAQVIHDVIKKNIIALSYDVHLS